MFCESVWKTEKSFDKPDDGTFTAWRWKRLPKLSFHVDVSKTQPHTEEEESERSGVRPTSSRHFNPRSLFCVFPAFGSFNTTHGWRT